MSVVTITKDNFEKEVLQSEKPVLLDFSAEWCGPCNMLAPVIKELANEQTDFKVCKVDVDQQQELAQKFQVSSIPTILVFKDGKVTNTTVGVQGKDALMRMMQD